MLRYARPSFQLQLRCGGGRWAALVEYGRNGVVYLGRPEQLINNYIFFKKLLKCNIKELKYLQ